ncbi:response regulator transcription factor [Sphingomonas donggukensis]|uniref:Response regulator transcription factor n=1 Tax=Sphingomonas donggukensis TaxID=2949093 RepID=A0ABY4TRQ2_9SPHN|nr:response regulator transcription factor [Sphingomonas donggukensis]URW75083.1 response regulator transcription factor [Sphingomonas donggukensis]
MIADDHPMVSTAMKMAVNAVDPAVMVETASTLGEAEQRLRARRFDLLLLDLLLPDVQGFAGLAVARALAPTTPIAIVSSHDDEATVRQAARLGARGFISKAAPVDDMMAALRVLLDGGQWLPDGATVPDAQAGPSAADRIGELSVAQLRVLRGTASGRQNKQIAFDLGISEPTVKSHLSAIFKKLGVTNRTQAVLALRSLDGDAAAPDEAIETE